MKTNFIPIIIISLFTFISFNCQEYDEVGFYQTDSSHRNGAPLPDDIDSLAFTAQEIDTIILGDTNTLMRILLINNYEDSLILRTHCKDVRPDSSDEILQHLIKRMYKTVTDILVNGERLAAPQVGISRNIICVQRKDKAGEPFEVYINPKIVQYTSSTHNSLEDCLSMPDIGHELVSRSRAIHIEYYMIDGTHYSEVVTFPTSDDIQHAIDHLNGVLYID